MLQQLARLSLEADGRYATATELQFLKDYLQSLEQRVCAYEKIRAAEEEIVHAVEAKKRSHSTDLFQLNAQDITQVCRRDMVNVLRYSATALLFNDCDRLRESLLLWYRTIVRSFKYESYADVTYQVIQDVVKQHLTAEEAALLQPILALNHVLLGS